MADVYAVAMHRTVYTRPLRLKRESRQMPKTNFAGATATAPSANAIQDMGAGAYIVKVTNAYPDSYKFRTKSGVEVEVLQVRLVFDVAAGEYEGEYADEWGRDPSNDWAHSVAIRFDTKPGTLLWYFEKLTGGEAREVKKLSEAWNTDDWASFKGLTFGLAAGAMHYTNSAGYDHVRPDWRRAKWHTAGEVAAGAYELPGDVDSKGQPWTEPLASPMSAYATDDVPF